MKLVPFKTILNDFCLYRSRSAWAYGHLRSGPGYVLSVVMSGPATHGMAARGVESDVTAMGATDSAARHAFPKPVDFPYSSESVIRFTMPAPRRATPPPQYRRKPSHFCCARRSSPFAEDISSPSKKVKEKRRENSRSVDHALANHERLTRHLPRSPAPGIVAV